MDASFLGGGDSIEDCCLFQIKTSNYTTPFLTTVNLSTIYVFKLLGDILGNAFFFFFYNENN